MGAMKRGTVDLIAIGPSLTKRKDPHATPNSLAAGASFMAVGAGGGTRLSWPDEHKAAMPGRMNAKESARAAHAESMMGAYTCYMAVCSWEMRRLWKPPGCVYLYCGLAEKGRRIAKGRIPDDVTTVLSLSAMIKECTGYPIQAPLVRYEHKSQPGRLPYWTLQREGDSKTDSAIGHHPQAQLEAQDRIPIEAHRRARIDLLALFRPRESTWPVAGIKASQKGLRRWAHKSNSESPGRSTNSVATDRLECQTGGSLPGKAATGTH